MAICFFHDVAFIKLAFDRVVERASGILKLNSPLFMHWLDLFETVHVARVVTTLVGQILSTAAFWARLREHVYHNTLSSISRFTSVAQNTRVIRALYLNFGNFLDLMVERVTIDFHLFHSFLISFHFGHNHTFTLLRLSLPHRHQALLFACRLQSFILFL